VFVGLDAASSESGDAWEGFLTGLGERGLRCPLLVISDGAAGLIGALEQTMGAALRQRCLVHYEERLIMWSGRGCDRGSAARYQRAA
jgi:putative transposase